MIVLKGLAGHPALRKLALIIECQMYLQLAYKIQLVDQVKHQIKDIEQQLRSLLTSTVAQITTDSPINKIIM